MSRRIEIRPNCSASGPLAWLVFGCLAGLCLGIALFLTLLGFWPVLPFAGLEIGLLVVAVSLCRRRSRQRELIQIEDHRILVDRVAGDRHQRHEFPRQWLRVDLLPGSYRYHPSRLMFRSGHRVLEIGQCLTEDERLGLWRRLRVILKKDYAFR